MSSQEYDFHGVDSIKLKFHFIIYHVEILHIFPVSLILSGTLLKSVNHYEILHLSLYLIIVTSTLCTNVLYSLMILS